MDPVALLPFELSLHILGYFDVKELGRSSFVSKYWAAIANDQVE